MSKSMELYDSVSLHAEQLRLISGTLQLIRNQLKAGKHLDDTISTLDLLMISTDSFYSSVETHKEQLKHEEPNN